MTNDKMNLVQPDPFIMESKPVLTGRVSYKMTRSVAPYESDTTEVAWSFPLTEDSSRDEEMTRIYQEIVKGLCKRQMSDKQPQPEPNRLESAAEEVIVEMGGIEEKEDLSTYTSTVIMHAMFDLWRASSLANVSFPFGNWKEWPSGSGIWSGENKEGDDQAMWSFFTDMMGDGKVKSWSPEGRKMVFNRLSQLCKEHTGQPLQIRP